MKRLRRMLRGIYNFLWYILFSQNKKPSRMQPEKCAEWEQIVAFIHKYSDVQYRVHVKSYNFEKDFKWVGGVYAQQKMIGIANGARDCFVMDLQTDAVQRVGEVSKGAFKWSGGCYWNNNIYGFPRSSNHLLVYENLRIVKEKKLHLNYHGEHHYGGVCTKQGIVYQPPRSTNTIMKIDLRTGSSKELPIAKIKKKFRYCGSILHPNGLIYMFPEYMGRVMVLDPRTDDFWFIGKILSSMVFGACVAIDGNIYGFSAYSKGILKIDVNHNNASMICSDRVYGSYGTALGVNGNLYSIPGDGDAVYEFDIATQAIKKISHLIESGHAKCAGSCTAKDGRILCVPALGNKIYELIPDKLIEIPENIVESVYFNGCY